MQLERLLNGLSDSLEQCGLTGVGVGSTLLCSALDAPHIYTSFVVKGVRYVRGDWMSPSDSPYIQLAGDYFESAGVQTGYIVLSQDGGASLNLYEGPDDFASGQKPLSIISEIVLVR